MISNHKQLQLFQVVGNSYIYLNYSFDFFKRLSIKKFSKVQSRITKWDSLDVKYILIGVWVVPDIHTRLIATQNKDSIDGISTGLKELENFGLLVRVHVQGGYDYEIFDEIKIHSRENPLNGKSTKQKGKIHLMENRPNISNKEFIAKEEEENKYTLVLDSSIFPDLDFYIDYCISCNTRIKNPVAYRAKLKNSFFDSSDKFHDDSLKSYYVWHELGSPRHVYLQKTQNNILPDGVNIFDLIGRG